MAWPPTTIFSDLQCTLKFLTALLFASDRVTGFRFRRSTRLHAELVCPEEETMGQLGSREKKEIRTALVGLENAGKTTALYRLKFAQESPAVPTIGFCVETFLYKELNLVVMDMQKGRGMGKLRPLWKHYFEGLGAIIFMVDASDLEAIGDARTALWQLVDELEGRDVIVAVLANKQDKAEALGPEEVALQLRFTELPQARKRAFGTAAADDRGSAELFEALDWILEVHRETKTTTGFGWFGSKSGPKNSPQCHREAAGSPHVEPVSMQTESVKSGGPEGRLNRDSTDESMIMRTATSNPHPSAVSPVRLGLTVRVRMKRWPLKAKIPKCRRE
uniref:Uncharacterized protein n=1 Tax=Chromera velia CCMP2878 TaxID=1169474 RepID=A0A0G4HD01_9ALVE|eukprot:Cvel_26384.t1-p1 / transcript=Cvel_26384.t1 / gene=Cvel_26384 / organism=Chromera_velia_CCMP2878 / gene_product=ADP-ribosylation factor 1, putative / transcript_product=ADP-ribosylation factor 1, putative / location=Cvel_scaffold3128:16700-17695(-) / protein_length=332 / sequence_SO=supercontig / SO=protein_coding / is_pseudo=false